MTSSFQLCTLNENRQTIYTTELFECDCVDLFGRDDDRDGSRNVVSTHQTLTIAPNKNFKANSCDTLSLVVTQELLEQLNLSFDLQFFLFLGDETGPFSSMSIFSDADTILMDSTSFTFLYKDHDFEEDLVV